MNTNSAAFTVSANDTAPTTAQLERISANAPSYLERTRANLLLTARKLAKMHYTVTFEVRRYTPNLTVDGVGLTIRVNPPTRRYSSSATSTLTVSAPRHLNRWNDAGGATYRETYKDDTFRFNISGLSKRLAGIVAATKAHRAEMNAARSASQMADEREAQNTVDLRAALRSAGVETADGIRENTLHVGGTAYDVKSLKLRGGRRADGTALVEFSGNLTIEQATQLAALLGSFLKA